MPVKFSMKLEDVRLALLDVANSASEAGDPAQYRSFSDLADTVESAQTLAKERMAEIRRAREIIERVSAQREQLLGGLTRILGLATQTHHVTDSTMRQRPTECLSRYRVKEIIDEAFAKAGIT